MSAIQLPPGSAEQQRTTLASIGFVGRLYDYANPGTINAFIQRDMACAFETTTSDAQRLACINAEKDYQDMVDGAIKRLMILSFVLAAIPVGIFVYKKRKAG